MKTEDFSNIQGSVTKSVTVTFLFRLEGLKLNDTDWINDFKEKRTQYGVSQNRLAVMAGISREYVSRIESGKVALTEEIKGKFTDALEKLNPENPLEMVLDYVRIRFPTQDVRHVVEDILQLKLDVMIHEDYGFYYNEDTYFVNTIKYAKSKLDLPFWWYLRKVPMSDDTLYKLNARADITFDILRKIQQEGYTLVRTPDPEKRKELTLILKQIGIKLS